MAALQYLQENDLMDYTDLERRATEVTDRFHVLSESIKTTEDAMSVNTELIAAVVDYAKTRPVFDGYKAAKYIKKYLAEHGADIDTYRAAQAIFKLLLSGAKLPQIDTLRAEGRELAAKKRLWQVLGGAKNYASIVYLKKRNICVCPMGEVLYPGSYRKKRHIARYYNTKACAKCTQKCTSARFAEGEVVMKRHEFSKKYNDGDLKLKQIDYVPDKQLLKRRKSLSEHPFGIVKRGMGADYLLLKRISGATAELAFIYLAFN